MQNTKSSKSQTPTEDNKPVPTEVELTQLRRQDVIASIDIAIHQEHQLKTLLNQIVEVVTVFLPSTGGSSIFLWNKDLQAFEKSATTLEDQDGKEVSRDVRNQGGATRWIVDNQDPCIVSDIYHDPFTTNPNLKEAKVMAYVGIPLLIDNECIGVLYALSKEKRDYRKTDIEFLENLGMRAAVAIKHITLLDRMQQTNTNLENNLDISAEKDLLKSPLHYAFDTHGSLQVTQHSEGQIFSKKEVFLLNSITQHINVISHSYLLARALENSKELFAKGREEERKRIRRDFHDGLGPKLASTALQLESARKLMYSKPEQGESILKTLETKMLQTLKDVRRIIQDLYPSSIDEFGLEKALRRELETFEFEDLKVTLNLRGQVNNLDAATKGAVYRIIQEAIHNVHKHASASHCSISIATSSENLTIFISDDGIGLASNYSAGIGLNSIRERVAELNGKVSFEAANPLGNPLGLLITVVLPLNKFSKKHS